MELSEHANLIINNSDQDFTFIGRSYTNLKDAFNKELSRLKEIDSSLSEEKMRRIIDNGFISDFKYQINRFMRELGTLTQSAYEFKYPLGIYQDIRVPHIISAPKNTDRIRQQQGAYIWPAYPTAHSYDKIVRQIGSSINSLHLKNSLGNNIVMEIESGKKEGIIKELNTLGINEGYVYADIRSRSSSILRELELRRY